MRDLFGEPAGPAPENPRQAVGVAHLLGLTPMDRRGPVCHGYPNGCRCTNCAERSTRPTDLAPRHIRQPWEPLPLDDAA